MKKVLSMVLVLFVAATGFMYAGGQQEDTAKGEIVITILHYKAGQNVGGKFFLPQVERFNEKYAGTYKLVIEEIPQDSYMNKIKQLAQQNKLPALIEGMDEEWFFNVIAANEMSLDLSDWLKSNRAISDLVIDASLDFVTGDNSPKNLCICVRDCSSADRHNGIFLTASSGISLKN